MRKFALVLSLALGGCQTAGTYPGHWWKAEDKASAPKWEILPQEAAPGEVIVSKRNELGILSNFAATPFTFRGRRYASMEGFWQAMKYPEGAEDPRHKFKGVEWTYSRAQVEQMTAFEAKKAGSLASDNMKKMGINWVTFEGRKIEYKTREKGEHYRLVREAMLEKMKQNPDVRKTLLLTRGLKLRPDHVQEEPTPPAWKYHEIWSEIRDELSGDGL